METKNNGITLIALIITIIVLLILAGVTIATLTGNHGILSQVDEAKVGTIKSKVEEEIGLAVQSANLKIRTKTATDNSWNATTEGILPTTAIAKTETKNITSEATNGTVLVTLLADLQKEGYYVEVEAVEGEGTGATRKITITYEGSDYRKAKKDNNAKITKTLDVSQNKIIYGDCNHVWEDGEVITAATCAAAGSKNQTCIKCGETQTVTIEALGHNFVDGVCTRCLAETIPTTEGYVGYYADVDGNGIVDGIIFADQARGNTGDGQWTDGNGNYTIPKKEEGLKNYYISQAEYPGAFGTKPVLSSTGIGDDRFYVMALSDFGGTATYYWYKSAEGSMSDYSTATSGDFGKGKQNTEDMITAWYTGKYGEKDANDMWGKIKEWRETNEENNRWFVPSRAEWSAFAEELEITNYESKGLADFYWSSSLYSAYCPWATNFYYGCMTAYSTQRQICAIGDDFLIL